MALASGHKAVPLEGEELAEHAQKFRGETMGLVRLDPGKWLFPQAYTRFADNLYNFKWRQDDVCVLTYPKCGTTWTTEIVWNMRNNPNLNNPTANEPRRFRTPFLDLDMLLEGLSIDGQPPTKHPYLDKCPGADPKDGVMIQITERLADPRTIKTHLPFSLLSPKILDNAKVIYVARNPKDVVISFHHHCRLLNMYGYVGSLEEFVKYFVEDNVLYGPYWLTLKEAWERRNHPNLHIMFYEDMKKDIIGELKKIDAFIGTNLTQMQLENIAEWTNFNSMKARSEEEIKQSEKQTSAEGRNKRPQPYNMQVKEKDGGFFYKGETGTWKNHLTPELEALIDDWTKKNISGLGVDFKYSIL